MDLKASDPSPEVRQAAAPAPCKKLAPAVAPMFRPSDHDAELSEEEFRLLRDFIHERFGLYFDDNQRGSLRTRLAGRLAQPRTSSPSRTTTTTCASAPQRAEEQQRMVSHLTNNETYFFREQPQLQVFADTRAARRSRSARRRRASGTLRVLSAGCSTGEEALTLAMIVYDSGQFFWNWDVQVIGLDVDPAALEKARRGVYHQNSLPGHDAAALERHFVEGRRRACR